MHKPHRPLFAAVLALGLGTAALPAFAVGAKCPASTTVQEVTPEFDDGVLRCITRARAPVACLPPNQHQIMPHPDVTVRLNNDANRDYCRPLNLVMAAPNQAIPVNCPPGMGQRVQNGRDYCRANGTSQVAPLLIPN